MPVIPDMAQGGTPGWNSECGLRSHFQKQTGPVLQKEPDSSTPTAPTATDHMASYLDSDSDDSDHLHPPEEEERWPTIDMAEFVEPPRRRVVSKRIDSHDISRLTQVNRKTAVRVCTILNELGVKNVIPFVSDWNAGKFRAIENFTAACIEFNLPFELDSLQISAFIDRLDECFYAPSTLDCQWGTLRQVAKELNFEINHEHFMHYKAVKADCHEVTDCRIPVSRELLIEMCNAAMEIFTGYTTCLARSLLICAWAFSMRISEYSLVSLWKKPTDKEDKSHNIRYYAIRVSSRGLSVQFISDKTAKAGDPIKHRTISWKRLPDFAKGVMKCYEILRKGPTYFCMEDSQPLD